MPVINFDLRNAFAEMVPCALRTEGDWRPHDLLTYEQAAEEFNLPKRTLRHLHQTRRVRSYIIGHRVRFRWLDIHDYLESCATKQARR
jgi:excisionase family DNA binding protein